MFASAEHTFKASVPSGLPDPLTVNVDGKPYTLDRISVIPVDSSKEAKYHTSRKHPHMSAIINAGKRLFRKKKGSSSSSSEESKEK